MCFSSATSFGAAALLAATGVASIARVRHQREILFAAIPVIFAVQQVVEGFIWLSMGNLSLRAIKTDITYFFLFVAESVWPVWVPLSLLLLERSKHRRTILIALLVVGLFTSVYLAFYLLTYGVEATVSDCHILYLQHLRSPYSVLTSLPYLLATILPFFVSGVRGMRWLGVVILAFYLLTKSFYDYQLLSVWSFYAGLVSIFIYSLMKSIRTNTLRSTQNQINEEYENR